MGGLWAGLTNEFVKSPLPGFTGDVQDDIAGEDGVGDVEDLALETSDGGPVPSDIQHDSLHPLFLATQPTQVSLRMCYQCCYITKLLHVPSWKAGFSTAELTASVQSSSA